MKLTLQQIQEIASAIKRKTAMTAYSLTICPNQKPGILDSKFGGLPYWDESKTYPVDSNGNSLILLAQINFDKIHPDVPLPGHGMLQFFIGTDREFGIDYECPNAQDTFRIVYHETLNTSISREDIEKLNLPDNTKKEWKDSTPLYGEWAVECEKKVCSMNISDMNFVKMFFSTVKELYGIEVEETSLYDALGFELLEALEDELNTDMVGENGGHWILGYPGFTQEDPRDYSEEYAKYDTLLFQMDSDGPRCDYVLWGDVGVGNFFINREALERKDFSDILYNWDCC